mgnify:CR=1 FL=1
MSIHRRSIKDRMVNVARMVKDKEVWERLLVRCQAANEVLSMPRFNPDIFFRKRVVMETKVGATSRSGGRWRPYLKIHSYQMLSAILKGFEPFPDGDDTLSKI